MRNLQYFFLFISLFLLTNLSALGQATSTVNGGRWSEASTWENGIIPQISDEVILKGPVELDTSTTCASLTLLDNALFQNYSTDSYILEVDGSVNNHGIIKNQVYNLYLKIAGDLQNYGQWQNYYTALTGTNDQLFVTEKPFKGSILVNTQPQGLIIVTDTLMLEGTSLDMNNDTLLFSNSLYLLLSGGYMDQTRVVPQELNQSRLQVLTNDGMVFQKSRFEADSIFLLGKIQFQSAPVVFKGNTTLLDTLQNHPINSYSVTIDGNFINKGYLIEETFKTTIKINGNITNYGVWDIYQTQLTGANNQIINTFSPVECDQFVNQKTGGNLYAGTSLFFENTSFNCNNDTIFFENEQQFDVSSGSLQNIKIKSSDQIKSVFTLLCQNNVILSNFELIADSAIVEGKAKLAGDNNFFSGKINLTGNLTNLAGNSAGLVITGNFTNQGSLYDESGTLNLFIDGNICQSGTWNNSLTLLTAEVEQTILTIQPFECDTFRILNTSATIQTQDKLSFTNVCIDLNASTLNYQNSGLLFLSGSSLQNGILSGMLKETSFINGSQVADISFPSTRFYGKPLVTGNLTFRDDFINHSIVMGTSSWPTLNMEGVFTNRGSIDSVILIVNQNIFNSGTTGTSEVYLVSDVDQRIELQNDVHISIVKLIAEKGNSFEWYRNGVSLNNQPGFSGIYNDTLWFNIPLSDSLWGQYQCLTNEGYTRNIHIDSLNNKHVVNIKLLLEGPFNSGTMHTSLQEQGSIPLLQPFSTAPWYFAGNEDLNSYPPQGMVDWLLIEGREAADTNEAITAKPIWKTAALLLPDGSVVNDLLNPLCFAHTITDSVYLIIRHRNHLHIITNKGISQQHDTVSFDFTTTAENVYGTQNALKQIQFGDGVYYALIAGDANQDGSINTSDRNLQWAAYAGERAEYLSNDMNLDGQVNNIDKNDYWLPNLGRSSQIPLE